VLHALFLVAPDFLGTGSVFPLVATHKDTVLMALRLKKLAYNLAEALVLPSLHEGFGLPIIEAMACGCPVITANVFAMPEVAGEAALLVDPYDDQAICRAMSSLLRQPDLKQRLREQGLARAASFSLDDFKEAHFSVYLKICEKGWPK